MTDQPTMPATPGPTLLNRSQGYISLGLAAMIFWGGWRVSSDIGDVGNEIGQQRAQLTAIKEDVVDIKKQLMGQDGHVGQLRERIAELRVENRALLKFKTDTERRLQELERKVK